MKEIMSTVKGYALQSAKEMTDEHRRILKQFIAFKNRTINDLNLMELWHEKMKTAEQALALRTPINEAAYAFDDNTVIEDKNNALGLYRSLIPKVKATSFKMMNFDNSIRQKDILRDL